MPNKENGNRGDSNKSERGVSAMDDDNQKEMTSKSGKGSQKGGRENESGSNESGGSGRGNKGGQNSSGGGGRSSSR